MDPTVPTPAAILLDFIGDIEAPGGYGVVYANKQATLPKPLTSMTVDEVLEAQRTKGRSWGSSASGRYQFMRATLTGLKKELGLRGSQKFDANLQDRLGYHLLKRRGYEKFVAGNLSLVDFGLALAKEWASLPVLAATKGQKRKVARGQSYYAGDGLNKSLVSSERVETALKKALAARGGATVPAKSVAPPSPVSRGVDPPVVRTTEPVTTLSWWERIFGARKSVMALVGTNKGDETLFRAQNQLLAAGYTEVGDPDGLWGNNTRTAIAAFLFEQAPRITSPVDWPLSDDILAAIAKAQRRQVSTDRASITAREAVARGSTPAKSAATTAGLGLGTLLTGLGGWFGVPDAIEKASSLSDQASGVLSTAQDVVAFAAKLISFGITYRWPILIAIGLYFLARGVRWIAETVIMIRTGSIRQTNL